MRVVASYPCASKKRKGEGPNGARRHRKATIPVALLYLSHLNRQPNRTIITLSFVFSAPWSKTGGGVGYFGAKSLRTLASRTRFRTHVTRTLELICNHLRWGRRSLSARIRFVVFHPFARKERKDGAPGRRLRLKARKIRATPVSILRYELNAIMETFMRGGANTKKQLPAHDPFFWRKQAEQLDLAAMLLWSAIREDLVKLSNLAVGSEVDSQQVPYAYLSGVFWLNAGLALENLLKGIIVQNDPASIVNGAIARYLGTHQLLRLTKRAAISLSASEAYFLFVGTECVVWSGRYPCSATAERPLARVFTEVDVTTYRSLFERFSAQYTGCEGKRVIIHRLA